MSYFTVGSYLSQKFWAQLVHINVQSRAAMWPFPTSVQRCFTTENRLQLPLRLCFGLQLLYDSFLNISEANFY